VLASSLGAGVVEGVIIALAAVGFTVIYDATGVVNFANGAYMVVGANIAFELDASLHWPFVISLLAAVACGGVLGMATDRLVIAPLRNATVLMQVMALVALSQAMDGIIQHTFGSAPRSLPAFAGTVAIIGGVRWSATDVIVIAVTVVVIACVSVFLRTTRLGLAMRATASSRTGVGLVGINPLTISLLCWGLGGALTALGGVLILPQVSLTPGIGDTLTFLAFAAVVLGGFGSLPGAIAGGLILGIVQTLVDEFVASGYDPFVSLVIMVLVLMVRPTGLLRVRAA
jgi:branched-subunit amino acid ABC-type transport system permease component